MRLWVELRIVAEQQLAEMELALDAYRTQRHLFEQISAEDLHQHLATGDVFLLDVRPRLEYDAGHLSGAIAIPIDELLDPLDELPTDKLIVTYCRGPLCVYADQALELITTSGRHGRGWKKASPNGNWLAIPWLIPTRLRTGTRVDQYQRADILVHLSILPEVCDDRYCTATDRR